MPRSRCQLGVRDPDVLSLLPLLARPHRHAPTLRTESVDTAEVFAYEPGLAPRAASLGLHLHQVGQRTFTSKLLSMPSTRRSRWRDGRYRVFAGLLFSQLQISPL